MENAQSTVLRAEAGSVIPVEINGREYSAKVLSFREAMTLAPQVDQMQRVESLEEVWKLAATMLETLVVGWDREAEYSHDNLLDCITAQDAMDLAMKAYNAGDRHEDKKKSDSQPSSTNGS